MTKRGPDPSVSSERILLEFVLTTDPALFASELAENLPLTRQRITQMLDQLEDEGYVESKHAAGRRLWWISPEGRALVEEADRDELLD